VLPRTVEDLVRLTGGSGLLPSTVRARMQVALGGMSTSEVAALARELAAKQLDRAWRNGPPAGASAMVFKKWLDLDPLQSLDFLLGLPKYELGQLCSEELTAAVAKTVQKTYAADRAVAIHLVRKMDAEEVDVYGRIRQSLIDDGLKGMPPQAALARMLEFDTQTHSELHSASYLFGIAERWMQSDPRKAMTWALAQPPSATRRGILSEMVQAWGILNPAEVQAFLRDVPVAVLPIGGLRQQLEWYAGSDPPESPPASPPP
jgi:hypothetical protein